MRYESAIPLGDAPAMGAKGFEPLFAINENSHQAAQSNDTETEQGIVWIFLYLLYH